MDSRQIGLLVTDYTHYRLLPLHFRWVQCLVTKNFNLTWFSLDSSTEFKLRPVLKERAAFVITFAIKRVCYSSRTTTLVHKQVRSVKNQTLFANIWDTCFRRKTYGNDDGNITIYYMASSASGQYAANSVL